MDHKGNMQLAVNKAIEASLNTTFNMSKTTMITFTVTEWTRGTIYKYVNFVHPVRCLVGDNIDPLQPETTQN